MLAFASPLSSALAQGVDSGVVAPYRRSEVAATALAWIAPGLGHLYAEERRRGETILVLGSLTFVGFAWAMVDVVRALCFTLGCNDGPVRWHTYAQGTMVGVGLGAWAFGVYDAHLAVRRQRNIRNRATPPDPQLSLIVLPRLGTSGPAVGVRWTW